MEKQRISTDMAVAVGQFIKERDYWLTKLSGELPKTTFPYDKDHYHGNKNINQLPMDTVSFAFPGNLSSRLVQISNHSDARLHVVLAAGLVLLLHKYSGNDDIIIGTPIYRQEFAAKFINTVLSIRIYLEGKMTFKQLLLEVRKTIVEAVENQNYPVEILNKDLKSTANADDFTFTLFDVAILLENTHDKTYIESLRLHSDLDMIFCFLKTKKDGGIRGMLEYNSTLYERNTIQEIISHFTQLFTMVLFDLDLPVSEIDILSPAEKERLLYGFSGERKEYPWDKFLHQLIEEQVEKTPHHLAVIDSYWQITYRQLNEKSNQLARLLGKKGVNPQGIVALLMENSLETIIGIVGILKSGGAYLPVDPVYPRARKKYMIEESETRHLLSQRQLLEQDEDLVRLFARENLLWVDDPDIYAGDCSNLPVVHNPTALSYVIYTSGSTGNPRGVMVENQGLINYICWAARTYVKSKSGNANFPFYTSISFDLTMTSIFTPLVTGHAIVVYTGSDREFLIEKIITENRVGVVKLTPSHLKLIREKQVSRRTRAIKTFIVGGEALETQLVNGIVKNFNENIEIFNEYGPTEAAVGCMIYKYNPGTDKRRYVPIGNAIDNIRIYLLDKYQDPVPRGVPGEIYISGSSVARGYLKQPGLTQKTFIPDPFRLPGESSARMFKTGDLAQRLPDGNIEFLGRIDRQVKIRGFRIELEEIESRLKGYHEDNHPGAIYEKTDDIFRKNSTKIKRCSRCLLTSGYPGIDFYKDGVCSVCREYEGYEAQVQNYFKTPGHFKKCIERMKESTGGEYDCLLLFSGGKDSSYILYQLVDMGLKVLTFTFDNGYISETAFDNINGITSALGVKNLVVRTPNINRIFVESLKSYHNVCHGCWNALNTLGAKVADENGINTVISGLSRGQIFDMRLHWLFERGIFKEEEIEEKLLVVRKSFHSMGNAFSRILKVELAEEVVEGIYFLDFFRYYNTTASEIKKFLLDNGWIQPTDTGFCSSNCRINDVGIYMHLRGNGYHSYEAPLSWDCRFGIITREEGLSEVVFKGDWPGVDWILNEIGYYHAPAITDAVVTTRADGNGGQSLCAYIVSDGVIKESNLRKYLAEYLPDYMIPGHFVQVDNIPLTPNGKVNMAALPPPPVKASENYTPPGNNTEKKLVELWSQVLALNKDVVGVEDNFFDIGGNSLNIIKLNTRLNEVFEKEIPVSILFRYTTIASFVEYLTGDEPDRRYYSKKAGILKSVDKGSDRLKERIRRRKQVGDE